MYLRYLFLISLVFQYPMLAIGDQVIKIGVILPSSGEMAPFGKIVREGITQANSNGLQLVFEDDSCVPAKTVTAFRKLVDIDRVSYILGPVCGSSQQAIAPLVRRSKVLVMLVGSGTRELFSVSNGRIFSPQYSIEDEAQFNARQLYQRGARRVALVFYEDVFCRKHEQAFRKHFSGSVVESFPLSVFDSSALKSVILQLRTLKIDGLYVPDVSPFLLGLRRRMAEGGMPRIPTISIYSAQLKDVLKTEGAYSEGLLYSYPAIKKMDAVSYFPKLGAQLLFDAVRECGNDLGCTSEWFRQKHDFSEDGVLIGNIELRQIKNGKFERVSVEQER